jgi:hypothetical protein
MDDSNEEQLNLRGHIRFLEEFVGVLTGEKDVVLRCMLGRTLRVLRRVELLLSVSMSRLLATTPLEEVDRELMAAIKRLMPDWQQPIRIVTEDDEEENPVPHATPNPPSDPE